MMRTPYTRAMLFLTFFKGPLTTNWTSVMNHHLNTQVQSGVPVNDEALWDHVYDSFRRQYAGMQEQERAEDTLQRGINMRPGEPDAYIAEYEVLVEMAGYDPNSRLTLKSSPMAYLRSCIRMCCDWIDLATTQNGRKPP